MNILPIDGSVFEGGGQILRMAAALSSILNIPIHVSNIRAGRTKGGLQAQHLTGLSLVRDLCNGKLEGAYIGSMNIDLFPKKIDGGSFLADTQTAGSVTLLIQASLPPALFGQYPTMLTLRGGTNAEMAPPVDYTMEVFKQIMKKFGVDFDLALNIRGFFPRGGGEVVVKINPLKESLKPVTLLERGEIVNIRGFSFTAGTLPIKMAHQMADSAERLLKQNLGQAISLSIERFKENSSMAFGNGSGLILWAETSSGCILGSSCVGKRGISPQEVGEKAAQDLIETIKSGSCVDPHMQDQANFNITDDAISGTVLIECEGINAWTFKGS